MAFSHEQQKMNRGNEEPWILANDDRSYLQRFLSCILFYGGKQLPRHIGIIMDGNRRFATKSKFESAIYGHRKGFKKLTEALRWCKDLNIREVSVYVFSIENFKRSKREVEDLMDLAAEKFEALANEIPKLLEEDLRITIIGDKTLIPKNILENMEKIEAATAHANRFKLNIAFAYTGRNEIVRTLSAHDTEDNTNLANSVDLLIRTSGENRLSDFLLWQTSSSMIYFTKSLWPEYSYWNFLYTLFYYQLFI